MTVRVHTDSAANNHPEGDKFRVTESEHLEVLTADNNVIARYRQWESVVISADA